MVDFLWWLLFRYPFHPRITAVARKRSQSFCQKCRWQVTAKHAYTLRMWLCMKWSWCMVVWCTQNLRRDGCSFMWHQPCQHLSTPLRWIFKKTKQTKKRYKAGHSCRTTCERSECTQESGQQRYISDHQYIYILRIKNVRYVLTKAINVRIFSLVILFWAQWKE